MGAYEDRAKLIWSSSQAGISGTISGAGNSGVWADAPTSPSPGSAISLSPASDFQLMVYVAGKTSNPTFAVQLGYYDDQGNLFTPSSLLLAVAVTGSAPYTAVLNAGARAGSGGSSVYFAFPDWAQISWTLTGGGSVTGVNVNLWGK